MSCSWNLSNPPNAFPSVYMLATNWLIPSTVLPVNVLGALISAPGNSMGLV